MASDSEREYEPMSLEQQRATEQELNESSEDEFERRASGKSSPRVGEEHEVARGNVDTASLAFAATFAIMFQSYPDFKQEPYLACVSTLFSSGLTTKQLGTLGVALAHFGKYTDLSPEGTIGDAVDMANSCTMAQLRERLAGHSSEEKWVFSPLVPTFLQSQSAVKLVPQLSSEKGREGHQSLVVVAKCNVAKFSWQVSRETSGRDAVPVRNILSEVSRQLKTTSFSYVQVPPYVARGILMVLWNSRNVTMGPQCISAPVPDRRGDARTLELQHIPGVPAYIQAVRRYLESLGSKNVKPGDFNSRPFETLLYMVKTSPQSWGGFPNPQSPPLMDSRQGKKVPAWTPFTTKDVDKAVQVPRPEIYPTSELLLQADDAGKINIEKHVETSLLKLKDSREFRASRPVGDSATHDIMGPAHGVEEKYQLALKFVLPMQQIEELLRSHKIVIIGDPRPIFDVLEAMGNTNSVTVFGNHSVRDNDQSVAFKIEDLTKPAQLETMKSHMKGAVVINLSFVTKEHIGPGKIAETSTMTKDGKSPVANYMDALWRALQSCEIGALVSPAQLYAGYGTEEWQQFLGSFENVSFHESIRAHNAEFLFVGVGSLPQVSQKKLKDHRRAYSVYALNHASVMNWSNQVRDLCILYGVSNPGCDFTFRFGDLGLRVLQIALDRHGFSKQSMSVAKVESAESNTDVRKVLASGYVNDGSDYSGTSSPHNKSGTSTPSAPDDSPSDSWYDKSGGEKTIPQAVDRKSASTGKSKKKQAKPWETKNKKPAPQKGGTREPPASAPPVGKRGTVTPPEVPPPKKAKKRLFDNE